MTISRSVARGLGAFSLGLGAAQLIAPRRLLLTSGFHPSNPAPGITRLVGVRELAAAGGLLAQRRPVAFTWMRVAGDAMDIALVGRAIRTRGRDGRALATLGAIAAITAVDLATSVALTQERSKEDGASATRQPVRRAITIGVPRQAIYDVWRQYENLPRFMRHVESVEDLGGGRSRWTAQAPFGGQASWEAETTEDVPGERIAWRSLPDATVRHEGVVRFQDAPGDRGTEVHVELVYEPPAGPIGAAVARLQNAAPEQQIGEDLLRLKQVLETGDVVASEAVLGERRLRQRPAHAPEPRELAQQEA